MEKVKEEIEKIVSELVETEFSIKVLEEDLPEKAVFQPSYAFSFSPSMPVILGHSIVLLLRKTWCTYMRFFEIARSLKSQQGL
jgi:hypothetical protein